MSLAIINDVSDELSEWKLSTALPNYLAAHPGAQVSLNGRSSIRMSAAFVASFFEPTFGFITAKVAELVSKQHFSHIVLVGGFGSSDLLLSSVRSTVASHSANPGCRVVRPLRPAVSVEYGAVLYGVSQASFVSHAAGLTSQRRHRTVRRPELREGRIQTLCAGGRQRGVRFYDHPVRCSFPGTASRSFDLSPATSSFGSFKTMATVIFDVYKFDRAGPLPYFATQPGYSKVGSVSLACNPAHQSTQCTLKFGMTGAHPTPQASHINSSALHFSRDRGLSDRHCRTAEVVPPVLQHVSGAHLRPSTPLEKPLTSHGGC